MAKQRKGILILNNWFELLTEILSPTQAVELLKLIKAEADGEYYESYDSEVNVHWFHMKPSVQSSVEKYAELCERRKEYGKMGGAPKGNQNARKNNQNNQKQPKQPMDKEKDKDKETYPSDKSVQPQHPLVDVSVSPKQAFDTLFNN